MVMFEDKYREDLALVQMVNQYKYMQKPYRGETVYDYFKSGSDGLAWDAINICGLAEGKVTLKNKSPFWQCKLNGAVLSHGLVDHSYIEMVQAWLRDPKSNWAYARKAHEKVIQYLMENK